jgi:hypothetical protein
MCCFHLLILVDVIDSSIRKPRRSSSSVCHDPASVIAKSRLPP